MTDKMSLMKAHWMLPAVLVSCLVSANWVQARNPIVQALFTADPAPLVHDGTLYLYTTHDEHTDSDFFTMRDWQLFSTKDMVNWTAHGAVASLDDLAWSERDNGAWAAQCIERNGTFYLYVPIHGDGIGVLVADTPYGPFKDALGHRFIESRHIWDDIDPTVFVDQDGQAYLYWGNPKLMFVQLNEDMISYDTSLGEDGIVYVEMTEAAFGERAIESEKYTTNYEEGPWLYERKGIYYMFYAAGGIPEVIAYSTGPTATGPWTYQGVIMEQHPGLAFTNHPGVVDFKGKTYFFYHDQSLPGGGGFNRSVCVEELVFNDDGSISPFKPTREGIREGIGSLNPYQRVEAESIAWSEGLRVKSQDSTGVFVTGIQNGDFLRVRNVDFSDGAQRFQASASAVMEGGSIEVRIGAVDGQLLGVCPIEKTESPETWILNACEVESVTGRQDLYLVFKGPEGVDLFDFDWWKFEPK